MSYVTLANDVLAAHNLDVSSLTRDERDRIERAGSCHFIPATGGYFKRCRDAATQRVGTHKEQRCDRHAAVDERTLRNRARDRGWKFDGFETEPYNARLAVRYEVETILNMRAFDHRLKVAGRAKTSAAYLLNHIEGLTDIERKFLIRITQYERGVK